METKPKHSSDLHSRLFCHLISLELMLAGLTSAAIAASRNLTTTFVIALLVALIGGILVALLTLWRRKPVLTDSISIAGIFQNRYGQAVPFALVAVLIGFLFKFEPDANALVPLAPLLICLWAIGIEMLVFFPAVTKNTLEGPENPRKTRALTGLLLAAGIAMIPVGIPSHLDGIPWNTPFEFIFVTLVLPFAFIVGGKFLSNRSILSVLGLLMILKISLMIFLPQSGLDVRVYSSEDALQRGIWEKSYGALTNPLHIQVTQLPYTNVREFPIEWINNPAFDENKFWTTIAIRGWGHLQENERLAIIVRGAKRAQVQILDALTQRATNAVLVEDIHALHQDWFEKIPKINDFTLEGTMTFRKFGQYRIEPVILLQDGSVKSAFAPPRLWVSAGARDYSSVQLAIERDLLNLIDLVLAGVICICLLAGLLDFHRTGEVSGVDLYLILTAFPAFYIARRTHEPGMNILILAITCMLAGAKVASLIREPRKLTARDILFSVGLSFLLIFLALDIEDLRKVTIFPQGQDGLEYQILARNIFVNGDFLLAQTPPRAYKVLFPYLAGFLHVLFGQSSSAQLFLSAWFALLSSIVILNVLKYYGVAPATVYVTSILLPFILCLPSSYIFYFRFGLIEPAAIFFLLITVYFAIKRQYSLMIFAGMLTVLFRLDYLSAALAAVLLTSSPITGTVNTAWRGLIDWFGSHWKLLAAYALALCLPPLLITLGYFFFTPNYVLSMSDTRQESIASILEGVFRVIVGGSAQDLRTKFSQNPGDVLLLVVPLLLGFLTSIASLGYRNGWFRYIDLRWALLTVSILPAYLMFRPTGYAPRFSLPLLPLDLVILGLLAHAISQKNTGYDSLERAASNI